MLVKAKRGLVFLMALVLITASLTVMWAPNAYAEGGALDAVIEAIGNLSPEPTVYTAGDRERVEAIQSAFEALSAEDQAVVDSTFNHPSGDAQSYGRILETAVWAVRSFGTDAGTTLADGTYTTTTDPAVSSESSKGKSDSSRTRNWWVESVVVENGQATAYIYVTSGAATASKLTSYPSIWYAGNTIARNADNNYPIPVDLNGITHFGGISSSMPRPIMYALSTTINETVPAADYTAVNEAIAKVPADLSIYTDESAAAVTAAVEAVVWDLPVAQQADVDAMAAAIEAAVAGLVKKPEPVVLQDGTYTLPELAAGPSAMFNHFVDDSRFLIVSGDTATIRFITDGSTDSIQKYSRIALGKSSEILPGNYQPDSVLPEGTTIIDGILQKDDGSGKEKYLFEVTLPKAEVEALLANDTEADVYITIWNKVGSSADKIPGWYKPSNDIYLSLGELGEPAEIPTDAIEFDITNNNRMFQVAKAVLEGKTLTVTMNSGAYDYLFEGHSEEAEDSADSDMIPIDPDTHVFVMEVEDLDEPLLLAFHSVRNNTFYDRTFTFDLAAKTLVTDDYIEPVEEIDDLTTEEAIAMADELASVEMVNSLIRALKVQYRDENTDKYCAVARVYYDALSDEEKDELIDPDYFGRDTGDASQDDPRNKDEIGEKEILVTSFGTSFNGSRAATIKAVEDALAAAYPDWSVRRAFTAQIIINHIQSRDGEVIDNIDQALERAVANGVKELIVQPTHLMHGKEYDEMRDILAEYEGRIDKIIISEPLLNSDDDKTAVAEAAVAAAVAEGGFASLDDMKAAGTALVFMGHGTSHEANVTYTEMQETMDRLGYDNVFVGTVEGEPEGTDAESILEDVMSRGYERVILRPLMVVAGDHANNDMADMEDEGSWAYIFSAVLGAENVVCQINGLGEIADVQQIYVSHVADALGSDVEVIDLDITNNTGMFKAVTAYLEKADGQTTLVMALSGTGYRNLFKGTYEQAVANGDNTENWIAGYTNDDGKLEFRIPVADGETYMPLVAVSQSYYEKYLNGQNSLERAFYPRQAEVNEEARTLVTGDYEFSQEIEVTNNVKMLRVNGATLDTVGGPNSNNYKADLVLTMGSDSYDAAYVGDYAEASEASAAIALEEGNIFTIPVKWVETFGKPESLVNLANGEPFYLSLKSKKNGTWYERIATLDEAAGTLVLDPSDADYSAVDAAKAAAEALDRSIYTEESLAAVDAAVAAVETGKFGSQQAEVDAMAQAITDAIAALALKPADYSAVEAAKAAAEALDRSIYTEESLAAVDAAVAAVEEGKLIDEQAAVDAMAQAITDAIAALDKKPADYSKVEEAMAKVPEDLSIYTEETSKAIIDAIAAIEYGKKIDDQAAVDAMAQAIEAAVSGLAVRYNFEDAGADAMTWEMGSSEDFSFTVHRAAVDEETIDHFTGIEIDGIIVAPDNYTAVSGSLKAAIKAAFMGTLSEGKHELKVNFNDGSAKAELTIAKSSSEPDDKKDDKKDGGKDGSADSGTKDKPSSAVKTGDNSNAILWIIIMAIAVSAGTAVVVYSRKKAEK